MDENQEREDTSPSIDVTQQKNLRPSQLLGYTAYTFFAGLGANTWSFRNMYYALIGMDLNLLTTVGLVCGLFDLPFTTVIGGVIEKVRLKIGGGGKYRPWLHIFTAVLSFGIIITFTDFIPGNEALHFTTALVGLVCVAFSMTVVANSQFGIIPLMAGASTVDRTRITTWNYRTQAVTSICTSMTSAYILTWFGTKFALPVNYTVMALCFGGFYIIGGQILRRTAKPFDLPEQSTPGGPERPKVKAIDMVRAVTGNSQLLIYLSANMLNQLGTMTNMNMIIYFWQMIIPYTHGIAPSASFPAMYTITQTVGTLCTLAFSMVGPEVGKRLGKKKALWIGMLGSTLSGVLNYFFGASYWLRFMAFTLIITLSNSLWTGFGINYALDCGEYGYWKTGQDNRLVVMSMNNVPSKIAGIVGGALMYALAAIGFDSAQVKAAAGGIPAFVNDTFVRKFMFLMVGLAAICRFCAFLLIRFGYKITDEDAKMYAAENQARKEAAEAAAA
ncbi:MAG: MFS transporter [Coriobacteriia bacterium]|nr:MFS transporter [Coriobacteriia bacterium]